MNGHDLVSVAADHPLRGFSVWEYGGWTSNHRGEKKAFGYFIERGRLDEALKQGAVPVPPKDQTSKEE